MKIAIVSDTHDNLNNFKKAIDWIKKENIQLILHCGDICNKETFSEAKKYFGGDIKFVRGNGDYDFSELQEELELEFNGKKIVFTHFPSNAKKLSQSGNYDMVFYGHTHRAWDEKIGNCHMINPGELAGHFHKATFAVYDTSTGSLELKVLENL